MGKQLLEFCDIQLELQLVLFPEQALIRPNSGRKQLPKYQAASAGRKTGTPARLQTRTSRKTDTREKGRSKIRARNALGSVPGRLVARLLRVESRVRPDGQSLTLERAGVPVLRRPNERVVLEAVEPFICNNEPAKSAVYAATR